jgi:pyruvate formate lyase activating enzyme
VTLVVPALNDSDEQLNGIARFLAGVDAHIPWHVTAFHPDYKLTGPPATPTETLIRAHDAGLSAGLKFVYAGNRPGALGRREDTFCPGCGVDLIRRSGFNVLENRLEDGRCPDCGLAIPGVWGGGGVADPHFS